MQGNMGKPFVSCFCRENFQTIIVLLPFQNIKVGRKVVNFNFLMRNQLPCSMKIFNVGSIQDLIRETLFTLEPYISYNEFSYSKNFEKDDSNFVPQTWVQLEYFLIFLLNLEHQCSSPLLSLQSISVQHL